MAGRRGRHRALGTHPCRGAGGARPDPCPELPEMVAAYGEGTIPARHETDLKAWEHDGKGAGAAQAPSLTLVGCVAMDSRTLASSAGRKSRRGKAWGPRIVIGRSDMFRITTQTVL